MPDPRMVTYGDWGNFSTPVLLRRHRWGSNWLKLTRALTPRAQESIGTVKDHNRNAIPRYDAGAVLFFEPFRR